MKTNSGTQTNFHLTAMHLTGIFYLLTHSSYNLEKVLNFSSRLEKSLNLVKVLEKYLISLLGLEKSLKFTTLYMPDTIFCKIRFFAEENLALTWKYFCAWTIFNYFCFFILNAISVPQMQLQLWYSNSSLKKISVLTLVLTAKLINFFFVLALIHGFHVKQVFLIVSFIPEFILVLYVLIFIWCHHITKYKLVVR